MITLDGDFHMMYYRKDVLEAAGLKAPTTWDEYLAVAKAVQRQGHERRRHAGLRLLHRQEAQRAELLVRHRRRRLDDPVEGHQPGHLLQHQGHDAAGQQRGLPQGARLPLGVDQVRPAGRAQPRRRRHPPAVRLRPLRAQPRLGRRRHASRSTPSSPRCMGKWGAAIMPGSKEVLELGHRQARRLHAEDLPACHRRRQPCAVRGLRRLGRRHQRGGRPEGEGRGLRLLLLHDAAGAVERRRHHRRHRLQPVPHLAAHLQRPVEEGRHERGGGQGLSRRHQGRA